MPRRIAYAAVCTLCCTLLACGGSSPSPGPAAPPTPTPAPTAEPTPRPVDNRVVGYWRFEEGASGDAAVGADAILDSSKSGAHGTPSGDPHYRSDVPDATVSYTRMPNALSLAFDSDDDGVRFPTMFPLNKPGDVTLEFWLKHPGNQHEAVIWGRPDSDDTNRFHVWVNWNRTLGVDYRNPDSGSDPTIVVPAIPFPPNEWTHFAIVRVGNSYHGYRDGTLITTVVDARPNLPNEPGWQLSGRDRFKFHGRLDELRITRAALSPDEFLNAPPTP